MIEPSTSEEPIRKNSLHWNLLQNRRRELEITTAFRLFRESGIEPILFKGWAAARFYPPEQQRNFSDIDFAVSPEDFSSASSLCELEEIKRLSIDLHNGFRHLDKCSWSDIFERSDLVEVNDTQVRTLSAEDHLRVVCAHWLTDGGEYKERLWDMYHLVWSRPADFDWSICLDAAGPVRRNWVLCTLALVHKYFGLPIDDIPDAVKETKIPGWMVNCLESEWDSHIRLRPLHTCLTDPRMLLVQIRKRVPPNPIQATVEMEGLFDEKTRVFIQIGNMIRRAGPSASRVAYASLKQIERLWKR